MKNSFQGNIIVMLFFLKSDFAESGFKIQALVADNQ